MLAWNNNGLKNDDDDDDDDDDDERSNLLYLENILVCCVRTLCMCAWMCNLITSYI